MRRSGACGCRLASDCAPYRDGHAIGRGSPLGICATGPGTTAALAQVLATGESVVLLACSLSHALSD